jgi:hypothetical protein
LLGVSHDHNQMVAEAGDTTKTQCIKWFTHMVSSWWLAESSAEVIKWAHAYSYVIQTFISMAVGFWEGVF